MLPGVPVDPDFHLETGYSTPQEKELVKYNKCLAVFLYDWFSSANDSSDESKFSFCQPEASTHAG